MNFLSYSKTSKAKIQKAIESLLHKKITIGSFENRHIAKPYKYILESTKGGKYIRGTLVMLGFSLVTGKLNPEISTIAAAYEILHTSLLTLDDVIDNSPLRRGKPSVWKKVGKSHAVLLSDIGLFIANNSIGESMFEAEKKIQATSLFSRIVLDTLHGEMLDVKFSQNKNKNEKNIFKIHQLKTAHYSISGPLMLGALLAGGNKKLLTKLQQFGEHLGVAFQIQDDILGVFGSEKEIGKSVTSDIEENKNTLLISYALHHGTKQQKEALQKLYGSKINKQQLKEIQKIFIDTNSLPYSQKKAKEYIQKAKKIIPMLTANKEYQKLLIQLCDFVIGRKK